MRITVLAGIIVFLAATAFAGFNTHSGMIRSIKDDKILLIEGGSEKNLEYGKNTLCYLNGIQVSCERIRPNSKVRIDCPTSGPCVRIIVDSGPR
ncbi:MAG: hypothetical protein PHD54_11475 [Desulfuromonadaceae bacterium]|nr:hypothetical protein [Desulfuromonadaceae bacterium]